MSDLRVPTISLPVEIRCADGSSIAGEIFLPSQSSRQSGPMRIEEWSDTVHAFFPFRSHDARALTILNRDAVVAVAVPAACLMNDSFLDLVKRQLVRPEDAYGKALDKSGLLGLFKRNGVDVSWAPKDALGPGPGQAA